MKQTGKVESIDNSGGYSAEEIHKIRNIPMSFILGMGRSGTTLLQNLLDAHPGIAAPPETEFIMVLYPRFAHIGKWKEKHVLDLVEVLYNEHFLENLWNIDRDTLTRHLLSTLGYLDYALACKVVFYHMKKGNTDTVMFFNKRPINWLFISRLLKIFPEAQFIYLVRDPRDTLYSFIKTFGLKNTPFLSLMWLKYSAAIETYKKIMPARYFTLLYEDMVTNPGKQLKQVCDFFKIEYSELMLQNPFPERMKTFRGNENALEVLNLVHANLMAPINTANVGKWKNGLHEKDRETIETITGDFANTTYGYEISKPAHASVTALQLLKTQCLFFIWKRFTKLRFRVYRFNIYYLRKKRLKRWTKKDNLMRKA